MVINKIVDFYWYHIINLKKYERKLIKYQGYGDKSIIEFKRNSQLKWSTIEKILKSIEIIDGLQLRNIIREIYSEHKDLFEDPNTFITNFGPLGKSGALIINQFSRCFPSKQWKIISNTELNKLPENSSIIFMDDFIGTGSQGLDYVKNISYSLNSSIQPYLFTICGTTKGIDFINNYGSKFIVKSHKILDKSKYHLLDDDNSILTKEEKKQIISINESLGITNKSKFHLGLPFAFFYSAPDNSLALLWSDKTKIKSDNFEKEWYGLIPREY